MSRFITSGISSAVRSIISHTCRQIHSMMAATGSSGEADVRSDLQKEDADDLCRISDSDEPRSDTELSNGNSVTASLPRTSDDGSDVLCSDLPSPKRQLSVNSGSRMSALGQEKDYSVSGMLFAKEQPKRQFHFSLWNDTTERRYSTRQQVVSEEKGLHSAYDFLF